MPLSDALAWTALILGLTGLLMFATVSGDMADKGFWRAAGLTGLAFIAIAITLLIASVWVQV